MLIGRSILRDMAAFIEERKMSRKKSNRLSLEQHKRTYRENQAAIAKALEQNAELEKAIIESLFFTIQPPLWQCSTINWEKIMP